MRKLINKLALNYDATLASLLTIFFSLWFIMFVDMDRPTYVEMVKYVTGVIDFIGRGMRLTGNMTWVHMQITKYFWGGIGLTLGLCDLAMILRGNIRWRRIIKSILFVYWSQMFFFLGIGNFYTTAFPMYFFVCVYYAILYLRLSK